MHAPSLSVAFFEQWLYFQYRRVVSVLDAFAWPLLCPLSERLNLEYIGLRQVSLQTSFQHGDDQEEHERPINIGDTVQLLCQQSPTLLIEGEMVEGRRRKTAQGIRTLQPLCRTRPLGCYHGCGDTALVLRAQESPHSYLSCDTFSHVYDEITLIATKRKQATMNCCTYMYKQY